MTDKPDEVAELVEVGPINRIPGTDSISCPGLPSGMMCLGWGEQGWAINDRDGKRIAAGNWGECATLPASQSEALVTQADREVYAQVLTELGIGRWAEDARNGVDDCDAPLALIARHRAAARAEGKREGIEEAAKVAEASPFNNGLNDAPLSIATAIRARLGKKP